MAPGRVLSRMRHFLGPSVWLEFTALAKHFGSINLGQGFPGFGPPEFVKQALVRASKDDAHMQYAHPAGSPLLRSEVARVYSPKLGFEIDPDSNVLVTVGASQALSLACHALLEEGDEVILFEPAFDIYIGACQMAGATLKYVPLRVRAPEGESASDASQLYVDMVEFEALLTPRTRMVMLNSPMNPVGKVFSRVELVEISRILDEKAPDCIVVSDEVYEHLVFDGEHIPFASISPSARERCISVYSAGKTFSVTGWKIGWAISSNRHVMEQMARAQQFIVFAVNSVSQVAVAEALAVADKPFNGHRSYYDWLREDYRSKRDYMVDVLKLAGMQPIVPQGTFYCLARLPDGSPLSNLKSIGFPKELEELVEKGKIQIDPSTRNTDDYNVCRNLLIHKGVASIPPSAFFCEEHRSGNTLATEYARFAFCKTPSVLEEAKNALVSKGN